MLEAKQCAMHKVSTLLLPLLLLFASHASADRAVSPLADAAEKQDHRRIQCLLKKVADVNAAQVDGMTALHWTAHYDDLATARWLVAAHATANAANRYGVKPLSLACRTGNADVVRLLQQAGANPNTKLPGGETALMTAARTGRAGPVKALLAKLHLTLLDKCGDCDYQQEWRGAGGSYQFNVPGVVDRRLCYNVSGEDLMTSYKIKVPANPASAEGLVAIMKRGRVICLPKETYIVPGPALGLLDQMGVSYEVISEEGLDGVVQALRNPSSASA